MSSTTATANTPPDSATNQDNNSVYEDLKGFLQSSRADLRLEATKAVLQVVASSDRKQALQLVQHDGILLSLLRIVSDTSSPECSANSLQAILYLSSSMDEFTNQCVEELLQANAVPRLVEFVMALNPSPSSSADSKKKDSKTSSSSSSALINYGLGILANLTRTEAGAISLVGTTFPDEAIPTIQEESEVVVESTKPTMELLLDRFLNPQFIQSSQSSDSPDDTSSHDPYQHFAAMLMNATQIELGRKFVLKIPTHDESTKDTKKSVLERLLPQLQHSNPIRRRGVSGCIRNCCLDVDSAWWMLNVVKIVSPLLMPLAGPEELDLDEKRGMDPDLWLQGPDKLRDDDSTTRLHCVESILLLCATGRKSRETLRLARTYVVLKYADMVEELESISDRINECVQYLRRDEEGTDEGSSDRMVEEATRNRLRLLPAPATEVHQKKTSEDGDDSDYDDVD